MPSDTTTYTLVAYNVEESVITSGMVSASATVYVEPSFAATYPVTSSAPEVSLFAASPNYIQAGQTAMLSWNVPGVDTVYISPAVGTVASASSLDVAPAYTTTYTLTASNSSGNVNATATVTVAPEVTSTSSSALNPGSTEGIVPSAGNSPVGTVTSGVGGARSTSTNQWSMYLLLLGLVAIASVVTVALLVRKPAVANVPGGGTSTDWAISSVTVAASQPATLTPVTTPAPSTLDAKFISPAGTAMPIAAGPLGRRDFQGMTSPDLAGTISRQHIRITFEDRHYYIEDLGSTNGTRLNGSEIRGSGRHVIQNHDRVELAYALNLTFKI